MYVKREILYMRALICLEDAASRALAELKGVAASMPNQDILISTLGLQEAYRGRVGLRHGAG